MWHVGFSSLIREETQAPCTGSVESKPLGYQGCPTADFKVLCPIIRPPDSLCWSFCAFHVYPLTCVPLFATPWTVAHQAPLSMGILQARILEWVAASSSTGSSQPRDRTRVSHIVGRFFTDRGTREVLVVNSEPWHMGSVKFPDWDQTVASCTGNVQS